MAKELKFDTEDSVEFHDFVADVTSAMMDADTGAVNEDEVWDMAACAIRHLMGRFHFIPKDNG